jgi:hypothetical protein
MIVCELTLLFKVSVPVCDGRTQLFTLGHMELHLQVCAGNRHGRWTMKRW